MEKFSKFFKDSCNAVRERKNGVEIKFKDNKTPHLLDINDDTCHTVNNCFLQFTKSFGKYLECLSDDIYFDLKSSDKRKPFLLCVIF